jgi:hypothetical protein
MAIDSALRRAGIRGLPSWESQRGRYDRLKSGSRVSEKWRRAERRRRMKLEYDAKWRAGEAGRRKAERDARLRRERERPTIEWQFTDDGQVLASDLASMGVAAGWVDAGGQYWSSSRHQAAAARAALLEAMRIDSGRAWPERWRLFAAGVHRRD